MNEKYRLTDECISHRGRILYRIQATQNFGAIKIGDLGGFIESKNNLNVYSNAWVFHNAKVYDNAYVTDRAMVTGCAEIFGYAVISESSWIRQPPRPKGRGLSLK